MSVLLDEKKSEYWYLGLPGYATNLRIQPTLAEFFDAHRPANVTRGDFLIQNTLRMILIDQSIGFRLAELHNTLVTLRGSDFTPVESNGDGR